METYTFAHTFDTEGGTKTTVTTEVSGNCVCHSVLTEKYTEWLRGCGFVIDAYKAHGLVEAP